jgi:hypothetical protein
MYRKSMEDEARMTEAIRRFDAECVEKERMDG